MNIKKYIKEHENFIKEQLNSNNIDFEYLKNLHQRKLKYIQYERLIHLIVTLFFSFCLLITIGFIYFIFDLKFFILLIFLFILVVAYVLHYFFLENTIQNWYIMMDIIEKKLKGKKYGKT